MDDDFFTDDGAKAEEKHVDDAHKKTEKNDGHPTDLRGRARARGVGGVFVGAKAEFGKVPSQAGSRAVAVGLNMGWAEYMVRLASFRCMHVSVCDTF